MKKIAKLIPFLAIVLCMYVFAQSQMIVSAKEKENVISEGIYIEDLHIGGMTAEEAEAALEECAPPDDLSTIEQPQEPNSPEETPAENEEESLNDSETATAETVGPSAKD